MIYKIGSTLDSFKTIDFQGGLNILISDKSLKSTERQTRNRAGKTSLIEIIHLLLAANVKSDSIFKSKELRQHRFYIEFDFAGSRIHVERSGSNPSKTTIKVLDKSPLVSSLFEGENMWGDITLPSVGWKNILGQGMFGLVETDDQAEKFKPTFRSLISYFVRRQSDNAFISPFCNAVKQQLYDQQVSVSFLIGLDWTIPQELQTIRKKESTLEELKKATKDGTFGRAIGTTAELRTQLALAERSHQQLRERVSNFQVLPEYENLETEASSLTLQTNQLADDNTLDRELILELQRSLVSENPPSIDDLDGLYREVGVIMPEAVKKRYDDVKAFHQAVISNRKSYLQGELQAAEGRIEKRELRKKELETRKAQIMAILKSHGALDQLTQFQAELARKEAELETIRQRFKAAEQLEGLKAELEIDRQKIFLRLQQNYQEQNLTLKKAILSFEGISQALYEDAGSLTIDPKPNGPAFNVQIHGARSKGISNMQIFCFDMMLMILCAEKGTGPQFLVHDSHLFDGVDERQVIKALEIGATTSQKYGFQYIVTLNSDQFPKRINGAFNPEEFAVPIRLTDATEDGGLFGIRFN